MRFRTGLLIFVLLSIAALKAQLEAQTVAGHRELDRQVELVIRSQFAVPPGDDVVIGARSKSDIPGYDTLSVTFRRGTAENSARFLISSDNTRLARFEVFSLVHDMTKDISVEGRPVRGNKDAKVSVVVFDDLECPACAYLNQELFPKTFDRYKDEVNFIYKDYPIEELHPWSMHAAVDANCIAAQSQEGYWKFVDMIHAQSRDIARLGLGMSLKTLDELATETGRESKADPAALNACLKSQDESKVLASLREGNNLDLKGTPTIFVNGERLNEPLPAPELWKVIDRALLASGFRRSGKRKERVHHEMNMQSP